MGTIKMSEQERIKELEVLLSAAKFTIDDLISTYNWCREDTYERGWSEMGNAIHEATFMQMKLEEKGYVTKVESNALD